MAPASIIPVRPPCLRRELLDRIGYDGWCTVEQDCAPDAAISKVELARANRDYLASVGF